MKRDKWRLSEYNFESFSHYLSSFQLELKFQEIINSSRNLWYGFSDSNLSRYIQQYESLNKNIHFTKLIRNHEIGELSEEFAIPLPYILQIWQILKDDNYNISFMDMLDRSACSSVEKHKAKEITTNIDSLDIDILFDYFEMEWTPCKSYLCDICILYSIWTLIENKRILPDSVYCKVLEIVSAEQPFLVTMLACLCLKSEELKDRASSFSLSVFPFQKSLFCELLIEAYSKDIYKE